MNVRFWGTRGSVATPGQSTVRYGGNTSCTQVTTHAGNVLILDCGTGARLLGDHLVTTSSGPIRGHIFITHTHWDHIQGFPFFAPVFAEGNQWIIYGPANGERDLEQALAGQMQHTYFPVDLAQVGAALECKDLGEGEFQLDGVNVRCQYLNHPAVTLGYRFEDHGASLVYATDHEPFSPLLFPHGTDSPSIEEILHAGDRRHAEFLAGADLLIHDAQYTAEEYGNHRNWGHSTVEYVVQLALVAGVGQLALYHHDPGHDDAALDQLQTHAQDLVRQSGGEMRVFVAREGDEIHLAGPGSQIHTI